MAARTRTRGGTVVYSVQHAEGVAYAPTKAAALRIAFDCVADGDLYVNVSKNTVTTRLGKRELYCALLNGEAWASGHEDVPVPGATPLA